jgi:hypothetical protein
VGRLPKTKEGGFLKMKRPIEVSIDLEAGAGYVEYLADAEIVGTLDIWRDGQVAADLDDAEQVVGIEVLGFDEETLARARSFAHEHGLAFPENLAGALSVA